MPLLSLAGIGKSYPSAGEVLTRVDLDLGPGETVAIVGPSGSGKSTLLQIMGTLERPSAGTVSLDGHATGQLSDRMLSALRARRIGFVFQQFSLFDDLTAQANVEAGLLYCGVPAHERTQRAGATLKRVGLAQRRTHRPSQLSGGEQQRVAIARALVAGPKLLLADEPTGNLDSRRSREIVDLLLAASADGTTLAVVTHDREIASAFSRQIELRDGEVIGDSRKHSR